MTRLSHVYHRSGEEGPEEEEIDVFDNVSKHTGEDDCLYSSAEEYWIPKWLGKTLGQQLSRSSETESEENQVYDSSRRLTRTRRTRSPSFVQAIVQVSRNSLSYFNVLFRKRVRQMSTLHSTTTNSNLDLVQRKNLDALSSFVAIRRNDPDSSFCSIRSMTLEDLVVADLQDNRTFFISRMTDPTSYFYRYRLGATRPLDTTRQRVELVDLSWLKPHEAVVSWERVLALERATRQWGAYLEPLLVDAVTGAILDGHHRYHVGKLLQLERLPAVMVDYLADESIQVDVWPDAAQESITKEQVLAMSLSGDVFAPKTSRHTIAKGLPPISIPLTQLRG